MEMSAGASNEVNIIAGISVILVGIIVAGYFLSYILCLALSSHSSYAIILDNELTKSLSSI